MNTRHTNQPAELSLNNEWMRIHLVSERKTIRVTFQAKREQYSQKETQPLCVGCVSDKGGSGAYHYTQCGTSKRNKEGRKSTNPLLSILYAPCAHFNSLTLNNSDSRETKSRFAHAIASFFLHWFSATFSHCLLLILLSALRIWICLNKCHSITR